MPDIIVVSRIGNDEVQKPRPPFDVPDPFKTRREKDLEVLKGAIEEHNLDARQYNTIS